MTIVGGLRARYVKQSLLDMISDSLDALGWFDSGRDHQNVTIHGGTIDDDEEIPFNTIVVADEDLDSSEEEMGSYLSEHRWTFYIDIYAEDSALGIHLSQDIRSILEGRMPSIGRTSNYFNIIDYANTAATPIIIGSAEIVNVMVDRAHGFTKPWQKNWYSVALVVNDYFGRDDDDFFYLIDGNILDDVVDGGSA